MTDLVLIGAGPVGRSAAAAALEDGVVDALSAVVDPDPGARRLIADDLGVPRALQDLEDLGPADRGGRAVVAFSSRAERVSPVLLRLVELGYHAVTTCEELAAPGRELTARLTAAAGRAGRVIVATGANPGFVMDRLPLLLAGASRAVTRVEVRRRVDTSGRRGPLVDKTGYGLSPAEFAAAVEGGGIGHVGLEVSTRLLAEGLGWVGGEPETSIEPVVGPDGTVLGLHQTAVLRTGRGTVSLDLTMAWGVDDPGDRLSVDGEPPLRARLAGGYHGDLGTTAQVVAALGRLDGLPPDFYRPIDLPLISGT